MMMMMMIMIMMMMIMMVCFWLNERQNPTTWVSAATEPERVSASPKGGERVGLNLTQRRRRNQSGSQPHSCLVKQLRLLQVILDLHENRPLLSTNDARKGTLWARKILHGAGILREVLGAHDVTARNG